MHQVLVCLRSREFKSKIDSGGLPEFRVVQEHEASWSGIVRGGVQTPEGESILSQASHLALMSHNYSHVQ